MQLSGSLVGPVASHWDELKFNFPFGLQQLCSLYCRTVHSGDSYLLILLNVSAVSVYYGQSLFCLLKKELNIYSICKKLVKMVSCKIFSSSYRWVKSLLHERHHRKLLWLWKNISKEDNGWKYLAFCVFGASLKFHSNVFLSSQIHCREVYIQYWW